MFDQPEEDEEIEEKMLKKKKKPETKKAKETKEKIKALKVKVERRKEALKEKASFSEEPEEKLVSPKMLILPSFIHPKNHFDHMTVFLRKIVDIEETQVLESTEVIEEDSPEVKLLN